MVRGSFSAAWRMVKDEINVPIALSAFRDKSLEDLRRTTSFVRGTGVSIGVFDKKKITSMVDRALKVKYESTIVKRSICW